MFKLKGSTTEKLEPVTFTDLNMLESDIEELLRNNIEMLCDDEESLLVVGRQVKNEKNGRSDLTAVDNNGKVVLIEIKRDRKDIGSRKEAFEFQAIRYAASYATITKVEELVTNVYAPYIEKYREEFELGDLTSYELGLRKLSEFLKANGAENDFNEKQKIILVASDFDEQTISAVAWLNSNNVDISCYKLVPYIINSEVYLDIEKVLPVSEYNDYYVNLMDRSKTSKVSYKNSIIRKSLPKINALIEWGAVKPGDIIVAKGKSDEATLLENGNVSVFGKEISLQVWLKNLYGWSSIQTYAFAIQKVSGKTLSQIREEYMERQIEEEV